jgi:hypothetical protein
MAQRRLIKQGVSACCLADAGCRMPDAGCRMPDAVQVKAAGGEESIADLRIC